MADDKRISELALASAPSGVELAEIVQGGLNKKIALQTIADLAADQHFKGVYASEAALNAAVPSAVAGDYAFVDQGVGQDVVMYIWDTDDAAWVAGGSGGVVPDADATTKGIVEIPTITEIVAGTDVGGTGAALSVLPSHLGITRTEDGVTAPASVQTDHNGFIILNSATPFNFTLDQLLAKTKITFINYGAGAVTFINGSGVTLTGSAVLPGSTGTTYPSALVVYDTLTTPRIISGTSKIDSTSTSTAGATITLDLNNQVERIFVGSASFGTAKAVALSNDTNGLVFSLFLNLTNVAAVLTFPSNFTMQTGDGRWADGAHTFTPEVTGVYEFSATFNSVTTDWHMLVTPTPYA